MWHVDRENDPYNQSLLLESASEQQLHIVEEWEQHSTVLKYVSLGDFPHWEKEAERWVMVDDSENGPLY